MLLTLSICISYKAKDWLEKFWYKTLFKRTSTIKLSQAMFSLIPPTFPDQPNKLPKRRYTLSYVNDPGFLKILRIQHEYSLSPEDDTFYFSTDNSNSQSFEMEISKSTSNLLSADNIHVSFINLAELEHRLRLKNSSKRTKKNSNSKSSRSKQGYEE